MAFALIPMALAPIPKASADFNDPTTRAIIELICKDAGSGGSAQNCAENIASNGPSDSNISQYCTRATGSDNNADYDRCVQQTGDIYSSSSSSGSGSSSSSGSFSSDCEGETLNKDNCGIVAYIVLAINFLSAVAMIAIIGSIMFAGYQYMTARDNPQAIGAAKTRIVWALVALLIFIFGYGVLNFLVPGGVL